MHAEASKKSSRQTASGLFVHEGSAGSSPQIPVGRTCVQGPALEQAPPFPTHKSIRPTSPTSILLCVGFERPLPLHPHQRTCSHRSARNSRKATEAESMVPAQTAEICWDYNASEPAGLKDVQQVSVSGQGHL